MIEAEAAIIEVVTLCYRLLFSWNLQISDIDFWFFLIDDKVIRVETIEAGYTSKIKFTRLTSVGGVLKEFIGLKAIRFLVVVYFQCFRVESDKSFIGSCPDMTFIVFIDTVDIIEVHYVQDH